MSAGWENKTEPNHELNAKVSFSADAKKKGMWIYDKTTKLLYTPHEFVWDNDVHVRLVRYKPDFSNFQMVDPLKYKQGLMKRANEYLRQVEVMEKRMEQYFRLEPKK